MGLSIAQKSLFMAIIAVMIGVFYRGFFDKFVREETAEFVKIYKNEYIAKYIQNLGFKYEKTEHIDVFSVIKSELFEPFDTQSGNDKISGYASGVRFAFSDLTLRNIHRTRMDYSGFIHAKSYKPLFTGLFFVASFNKTIAAKTFVIHKRSLARSNLPRAKMDDSEFNELFSVHCADMQNAMYILSPAFMQGVIKLAKTLRVPIAMSFLEDKIFIRIERGYNSFEPNICKNFVSKHLVPTIKRDLDAIFEIINILNLNNQIWLNSPQNDG